ncbi:MAG: hypothetical protein CMB75_03200 [Euryarchaeota archaeon]|nr:hypothetical protein [Euryarchaeota archaeon]
MEIKTYLNPKWWLIVIGAIFFILGAGNYLGAEGASENAYTDPTDRDIFYEQTFGLFSMALGAMALSTGMFVKGRGLAMLSIISSVAVIIFLILHYNAGEVVDYGYNNLAMTITISSILGLMGVGGYLHLENE